MVRVGAGGRDLPVADGLIESPRVVEHATEVVYIFGVEVGCVSWWRRGGWGEGEGRGA